MDIVADIKNWSIQFLPADLFVVNVEEHLHKQKITIYIDGDNSIDISACQKLSRHLSEKLDEQDFGAEPYTLEVSSPGADRPLLNPRQYPKHVGRELFIKLNAQTESTFYDTYNVGTGQGNSVLELVQTFQQVNEIHVETALLR